jgi:glyoxylase-like metal-dependent hydrolase (beta-lactamase superfamily II)
MSSASYRFKLGKFECVSLCDGSFNYPLQNFFANVPKAQIEAALQQCNLPIDFITTPYTFLYVNTGERRVLVGMGAGNLAPTTGGLLPNMRGAGINPADIDTVIITHAHPEQIGGTLDDEGKPIYTNAHYYMWKGEWEFWFSDIAFSKTPEHFVTTARKNLEPIQDQLTLLDRESEIMPGIGVIAAPGHTPGHIVISFSSSGEQLLFASDTVLCPLHLEHPDWTPIYDILPEEAAVSKRRIFDLAAGQKVLVMGHHFPPFPSLGYIVKQGNGWHWQPIEAIENERSLA